MRRNSLAPEPRYQHAAAAPTGARPVQSRVRESHRGGWGEVIIKTVSGGPLAYGGASLRIEIRWYAK